LARGRGLGGALLGVGVLLEEGILPERVMHLLRELQGRQLQQPHRVLESGRERLLLALLGAKVHRTHGYLSCAFIEARGPARFAELASMPTPMQRLCRIGPANRK